MHKADWNALVLALCPCELTHLTPCQDLVAAATAAAKAHSLTAKDTLVLTAPLHTPFGFVSGAVAAAITGAKVRPVWFPAHYPHRHTKLNTVRCVFTSLLCAVVLPRWCCPPVSLTPPLLPRPS